MNTAPDQNECSPAALPPPLTDRERMLWRIWLTLVTLLVVGSLILTGVAMYFGPAPVTRSIGHARTQRTTASTPEPNRRTASFRGETPDTNPRPTSFAGPGIVWVNTRSRIYHFPGYRWYGGTIQGKYVREQDALAEGDRAALNERRPADFGVRVQQ